MKKFLVLLGAMFVCSIAFAQTINVNWKVGNTTYTTNTCEYGDTLTVPSTTPTKYGYTFQGWAPKYMKLEYIESTGTQYIDTGYAWTSQNRRVFIDVTKIRKVDSMHLFGSTNLQGAEADRYDLNPYIGLSSSPIATYIGNNPYGSTPSPLNTRCQYEFDLKSNKTLSISYNSEVIYNSTVSNIPTTQQSVYLFHVNILGTAPLTYNPFVGKIYAYKMWDNGTLVRDMIPAKNSSGVVGMYDTVSGTFFTNAGTGTFTAGPVVGGNIAE